MKIDSIEALEGCLIIPNDTHYDERGFFKETWNKRVLNQKIGDDICFAQDNISLSHRHVLRGLHFQNPKPQAKLVYVINGSILDVIVDLRQSSSTFGCWSSIEMTASSNFQLWVPVGFAHGFMALEDNTLIAYKATDFWDRNCEHTLTWNDPELNIEWPSEVDPLISPKDLSGLPLSALPYFD